MYERNRLSGKPGQRPSDVTVVLDSRTHRLPVCPSLHPLKVIVGCLLLAMLCMLPPDVILRKRAAERPMSLSDLSLGKVTLGRIEKGITFTNQTSVVANYTTFNPKDVVTLLSVSHLHHEAGSLRQHILEDFLNFPFSS